MDSLKRYNERLQSLRTERTSWESHWREITDYLLPRTARYLTSERNRGQKLNQRIIDSTAGFAVRTFTSGMMAGMTSPARPWFRLTTADTALKEYKPVKVWLTDVEARLREVFAKSNLYYILPDCYRSLGLYGVAAFTVLEDFEETIRCYPAPVGSFHLALSSRGVVDTFVREYSYTVRQLVEEFGRDNCSTTVKNLFDKGSYDTWVEVVHFVSPNTGREYGKVSAKNKPFKSCWYEKGANEGKFLRESGFDDFPVMAPRWDVLGEDVYGFSPAMDVLGDVKQLQLEQKRKIEAIDKMVNPPMAADIALRNQRASLLPGDITYIAGLGSQSGGGGFRPVYEINPRIGELREDIIEVQGRIKRAFYEDMMLMFATSETVGANITAREVEERHQEKLLALGPYMERLNNELLSPLLDRTFQIMLKRGMLPPPPPELEGEGLKVEYISMMAQAQKLVGLSGLERLSSFVGNIIQAAPGAFDKFDADQAIDEYGEMVGAPPRVVRSDEEVAQIRQQRAQQEAAAQAAALAQPLQQAAQGAKLLSETDVTPESALGRMMGM